MQNLSIKKTATLKRTSQEICSSKVDKSGGNYQKGPRKSSFTHDKFLKCTDFLYDMK